MNSMLRTGLGGVLLACLWVSAFALPASATPYTYNRGAAANYALTYAYNYNRNYPSFGADCTNFVSQALLAGGWTSNPDGNPAYAWFYNSRWNYSTSWVNAHLLFNFTRNTGRGDVIGQGVESSRGNYNDLEPGDLIFADWFLNGNENRLGEDGWIDHVYIVTGRDSRGILVSAHTTDRRDFPFRDVFGYDLGKRGRFYYVKLHSFEEGRMYREANRPEVYLHIKGGFYWIRSYDDVAYWGGWGAIRIVPDGYLHTSRTGSLSINWIMVRERSHPEVYLVWDDGSGYPINHIMTGAAVDRYGGWGNVYIVPNGSMDFYRRGWDIW